MAKDWTKELNSVIGVLNDIKQDQVPPLIESPSGTRSLAIVDKSLASWVVGPNLTLFKDDVDTTGRGSIFLYFNGVVYTLGTDNNWWMWRDEKWQFYGNAAPDVSSDFLPSKMCLNLTTIGFWGNQDPFINRLKRSSHWWQQYGITNANYTDPKTDWQLGLPAGEFIANLICVQDVAGDLTFTEQRAGTHALLWKGPLSLSVTGDGLGEGAEISAGRYVVNVPATIQVDGLLTLANPAWSLIVRNPTEAVQDFAPITENGVQYPALIHADDEVDFLAGRHYNRKFIDSLQGFSSVRTMDWNICALQGVGGDGTVHRKTIEPEHFLTENCRTYAVDDNNTSFFPPEEIGYLAREANIGIFNSMPAKSSDAAFDYWGAQFKRGAGEAWQGELLSELGDENWNFAFPWNVGRIYLGQEIAPHINVVDINGAPSTAETDAMGCAAAARSVPMWLAMEKYVPRERHKRVLSGQFAWVDAMGGQLAYVDPQSGKRVSELADYFAVAPYWGADRTGLTLNDILQNKLWLQGDGYWIERCKTNIRQMVGAVNSHKAFLAKHAPNLKLTCYEGGGWLWEDRLPGIGDPTYTLGKQWDDFCRAFMDGEAGEIVTQFYWDTLIKGNFMLYNHYSSVGYGYGAQMGLTNSLHRSTRRQSLTKRLDK